MSAPRPGSPPVPPGSPVEDALDRHRSERDYIDRTIATVRNHRDADNCWPQWANIFADEIEDLRADVERLTEERDGSEFLKNCAEAKWRRLERAWQFEKHEHQKAERRAESAEAEVARLSALKDEVVELSAKLERGWLNATEEVIRLSSLLETTREGVRVWLDDVDDALSDGPDGRDAAIRIGARWDDHDAELRALLAASPGSGDQRERMLVSVNHASNPTDIIGKSAICPDCGNALIIATVPPVGGGAK